MGECREIFTMTVPSESICDPLRSLVKQVHQSAADMYADGDISRVEIYIEGTPGGKVEVRVDGELIDNSTLVPYQSDKIRGGREDG